MAEATVTQILREVRNGGGSAVDRLFPFVYEELRALAHRYRSRERKEDTLQTTALVHEAYLKLVDQRDAQWQDRAHFFAIAAQAMRRILVDHARGRDRVKRGGGQSAIPLDEAAAPHFENDGIDVIALDEAMRDLSRLNERQARVVELRYFGGLALDEVARIVGVSPSTVDEDWAMARAWLRRALRAESASGEK